MQIRNKKRRQAQICYDRKRRHLGAFNTKEEAALAYDREAREHGGIKRRPNYVGIEAAEAAAAKAQAEHTLVQGPWGLPRPSGPQPVGQWVEGKALKYV
jgi:hypothetical protein